MSPFSHGSYALQCRVCEELTEPEALDACRRCDGPTDIAYDWQQIRREVTRARDRDRPLLALAVRGAPADSRACRPACGLDAARAQRLAVGAARRRSPAQARRREPDRLLQGPDRRRRCRRRCGARQDDASAARRPATSATRSPRLPLRPGSRRSCWRRPVSARARWRPATPARGCSRSPARTTTAAGSSSNSARSSPGASSAATFTRTRARVRRRSRSRSPSSSAGSYRTRSSARRRAGCCSRSSPRASRS